jgi:ADP-ribose pyrophosphatase
MYKGNHLAGEIEIIKENIVFKNSYATLFNDDVKFPNGVAGEYLRLSWNSPYGVIIFPEHSDGRILLIKNFRHDTRSWSWDMPMGFGETDLTPLECAKKELKEETGFNGVNWTLFKKIESNSSVNFIYKVTLSDNPMPKTLESGEAISESRFFHKNELQELLHSQMINNPLTMFFIADKLSQ